MIKIVTAKINNARSSISGTLETALFSDGSATNSIDGLGNIVKDPPITGTLANIDRATYDWWRKVKVAPRKKSLLIRGNLRRQSLASIGMAA